MDGSHHRYHSPFARGQASVIFLSLILMVILKKHSFLKLDQFMRTDAAKRFSGRDKRTAVSDTTISRSLSTYLLFPLRSYLKSIFIRASHWGKCVIDVCGRKLKVACVDGSQFGRFYGCVLQSVGEANLLVDIEPTTGKGKEIPTTRILLDRVFDEYGDGFVDMFLLDGPRVRGDKKTINQVVSRKSHVLIKTTEASLSIIQDANGLFTHYEQFEGVEYTKGFDVDRLCEYEVWSCDSFRFPGVKRSMKVAHVKESYTKEERHEDFWVLCTDESLTGPRVRGDGTHQMAYRE